MTWAWALLAELVALYQEDPPGSGRLGNGEPYDPEWWRGTCDSVAQTAADAGLLWRYGATATLWGAFLGHGHCWLELDGWIIDPTVRQFGREYPEDGWALAPADPRQTLYERNPETSRSTWITFTEDPRLADVSGLR